SIVGTTGKQLIRSSEIQKQNNNVRKGKMMFATGLALNVIINPICDLAGYSFAPAAVIAPLTGMDIVWNTLVAPWTLNEELTPRRLGSAAIIFVAATVSVFFRQQEDVTWTVAYIREVFLTWTTLVYCLCYGIWFLVNSCIWMKRPPGSALRGFSLGATAGSLAGNMWCTKIVAEEMSRCIGGDCAAWADGITWVILGMAMFFAIANVKYMARGMQQYEALFMVTVFQGSNIVSNSISAIVVLGEMDGAPWWKIVGYFSCIVAMTASMVLLATGERSRRLNGRTAENETNSENAVLRSQTSDGQSPVECRAI
ncbi:unnamed protein product, partial [Polarella glacialis]